MGKLQYHLKHCNPDSPMLKSHLKTPQVKQFSNRLRDPTLTTRDKQCPNCHAKMPLFLYNKHLAKCSIQPPSTPNPAR